MMGVSSAEAMTGETVELLQAMIRNRCVNDGTAGVRLTRRATPTLLRPSSARPVSTSHTSSRRRGGLARRPHRGHRSATHRACA